MGNIFNNLAFAESIFLKETYSQILSDLNLKRSHGEIVRRLVSEGYDIASAESLYQTISSNLEQTENLLLNLNKEIFENEKKQETEYARERE